MKDQMPHKKTDNYADIIHLPHHVSKVHPQMSNCDRAAQFSPFAALTGHEEAIREAQRVTSQKPELTESMAEELNQKLLLLESISEAHPVVSVTYFKKDERKDGGDCLTEEGRLLRLLPFEKALQFETGVRIPFADILEINGEMFRDSLF